MFTFNPKNGKDLFNFTKTVNENGPVFNFGSKPATKPVVNTAKIEYPVSASKQEEKTTINLSTSSLKTPALGVKIDTLEAQIAALRKQQEKEEASKQKTKKNDKKKVKNEEKNEEKKEEKFTPPSLKPDTKIVSTSLNDVAKQADAIKAISSLKTERKTVSVKAKDVNQLLKLEIQALSPSPPSTKNTDTTTFDNVVDIQKKSDEDDDKLEHTTTKMDQTFPSLLLGRHVTVLNCFSNEKKEDSLISEITSSKIAPNYTTAHGFGCLNGYISSVQTCTTTLKLIGLSISKTEHPGDNDIPIKYKCHVDAFNRIRGRKLNDASTDYIFELKDLCSPTTNDKIELYNSNDSMVSTLKLTKPSEMIESNLHLNGLKEHVLSPGSVIFYRQKTLTWLIIPNTIKKEIMKMHNKKIPVEIVQHIADFNPSSKVLLFPLCSSIISFQSIVRCRHVMRTVMPQLKSQRLKDWIAQHEDSISIKESKILEKATTNMRSVLANIARHSGKNSVGCSKLKLVPLAKIEVLLNQTIGLTPVKRYIVKLFRDTSHRIVSQEYEANDMRPIILSGSIGTGKLHSSNLIAQAMYATGFSSDAKVHIIKADAFFNGRGTGFSNNRVNFFQLGASSLTSDNLRQLNSAVHSAIKSPLIIFAGRNKRNNQTLVGGLDELQKREPIFINLDPFSLNEMSALVLRELGKERGLSRACNLQFVSEMLENKWSKPEREARNIYCVRDAVEYILAGQRAEVASRVLGTSLMDQKDEEIFSFAPSGEDIMKINQDNNTTLNTNVNKITLNSVVLRPSHFFRAMGVPLKLQSNSNDKTLNVTELETSQKDDNKDNADDNDDAFFEKLNREKELKLIQQQEKEQQQQRETIDRKINNLIGMTNVKAWFDELRGKMSFVEAGGDPHKVIMSGINYNMVLTGNPGSGKSTLARLIHQFFFAYGLIKRDVFVERNAGDLKAPYCGQTTPKVNGIINSALGGTLFIDEAYGLGGKGGDKFNKEVVSALLTGLENNRGGIVVILAGYRDKMATTMRCDPGLQRRFPFQLNLAQYSPSELVDIVEYNVEKRFKMSMEEGLREKLIDAMKNRYSNQATTHNAGLSIDIVEQAITKYASKMGRLVRTDPKAAALVCSNAVPVLTASDFDVVDIFKKTLQARETIETEEIKEIEPTPEQIELLHRQNMKVIALKELNQMIGFDVARKFVKQFINKVKLVERGASKKILSTCMNLVLQGAPGTGKTTLARILHKIMYSFGIIRNDVFIEKNALELKGTHCGQTAPKVQNAFAEADGGTLFLDEAWALQAGHRGNGRGGDTFSAEAIATLLTELEKNRTNVFVIIAGYEDKMQHLLDSDPGMRRRFPRQLVLPDYTSDELAKIAIYVARERFEMQLTDRIEKSISQLVTEKHGHEVHTLNASLPIMLVEQAISTMAERLCNEENDGTLHQNELTLIPSDFWGDDYRESNRESSGHSNMKNRANSPGSSSNFELVD